VYRALLRVYPRDFRDEFGDAMLDFHRDRLSHARREGASLGVARVWTRVITDLARNAVPARVDSLRRRIRKHTDERDALRQTASLTHFQREDFMLASIRRTSATRCATCGGRPASRSPCSPHWPWGSAPASPPSAR
jgi:hypothetical protein